MQLIHWWIHWSLHSIDIARQAKIWITRLWAGWNACCYDAHLFFQSSVASAGVHYRHDLLWCLQCRCRLHPWLKEALLPLLPPPLPHIFSVFSSSVTCASFLMLVHYLQHQSELNLIPVRDTFVPKTIKLSVLLTSILWWRLLAVMTSLLVPLYLVELHLTNYQISLLTCRCLSLKTSLKRIYIFCVYKERPKCYHG